MSDDKITVDGYVFDDEKIGSDALKEQEAVEYVRAQVDLENISSVHAVYSQMLSRSVFHTPVGIGFLKKLQDILLESKNIDPSSIDPIPVSYELHKFSDVGSASGDGRILERQKKRLEDCEASLKRTKKNAKIFTVTTVILAVCVVAMFLITLSSESPTVLNYKQKLTDEYSSWADELTERERQVDIHAP